MRRLIIILILLLFTGISGSAFDEDVNNVLHSLYSTDYKTALSEADSIIARYDGLAGEYLKTGIFSTYMSDFETDTLEDSLRHYFNVITEAEHSTAYDYFFTGGAYLHYAYLYIWRKDYPNAIRYGLNAKHMFDIAMDKDSMLYDAYLGKGVVEYMINEFRSRIPFISPSGTGIDKIKLAADSSLFASIPAHDILAMIYTTEGQYEKADSIITALRKEYPDNRMFMFTQYKTAIASGDTAEALLTLEDLCRKIIDTQPFNLYNIAFCFTNMSVLYSRIPDTSLALMSAYAVKDIMNSGIDYDYGRLRGFSKTADNIIRKYEK